MPYDRDEAVAAVTEFYTFLTTHLHFDPSELKTPPLTGWPEITPARFSFLGKTGTVIVLLKHLPYLPEGKDEKHIYDAIKCAVYVGESADKSVEGGARDDFDVDKIWLEDCPYSPIRDTNEHIADLDCLHSVVVWDVIVGHDGGEASAAEFFAGLRREFEDVHPIKDERFKGAVRSYGWPPSQNDGSKWKRKECLEDVERLWGECG